MLKELDVKAAGVQLATLAAVYADAIKEHGAINADYLYSQMPVVSRPLYSVVITILLRSEKVVARDDGLLIWRKGEQH